MRGGREAADGGVDERRTTVVVTEALPAHVSTAREPALSDTDAQLLRGACSTAISLASDQGAPAAEASPPRWLARYRRLLILVDLLAAAVAVPVSEVLHNRMLHRGDGGPLEVRIALLLPVAWLGAVALQRGYEGRFLGVGAVEFQRLARAFLNLAVAVSLASYLARLPIGREVVVIALPVVLVLSAVGHYAARKQLHRRRAGGSALIPVLAVGGPSAVAAFAEHLRSDRHTGLTVIGACLPSDAMSGTGSMADQLRRLDYLGIPVFGDVDTVREAVRRSGAHDVAVLSGQINADKLRWISWQLEGTRTGLVVSPGLTEIGGRRLHIQPVAGLPLLYVDQPEFTGIRRLVKEGFDRLAATLAIVVLLPLLAGIALSVRLTSRGPALFRQTRVGINGKRFTMYKFRSMYQDAEARRSQVAALNKHASGPLFKMQDDPRVTRVGRTLRALSLDELPQLLNVLNGSMSLVGPRPPLPEEANQYAYDHRRRLLVKPGITGLWQVSGRSDLSWEQSIRLDLHYVENWSLMTDVMILWKTVFAVVRQTGAY